MAREEMETYLSRLESAFFSLRKHLAPNSEEMGSLTGPQFLVLRLLQKTELEGRPASDLAQRLGVSTSAMTGMVDRLVRAGLVERRRDQDDRRVVWVRLTEAGQQAVSEAQRRRRARVREVFSRLGEAELRALVLALEGAMRALDQKPEQSDNQA